MSKKVLLLILCLLAISGCQREKEVIIQISLERPLYDFAKIYYVMNKRILLILVSMLIIAGCQKKETVQFGIVLGPSPYDIAKEYYEEGDYENAIITYKKILSDIQKGIAEGGLNEYWTKCMMARSYLEIGEYDLAGSYIEEAAAGYREYGETGQGYDFICLTEGTYFQETEQYKKTIQSFEESIKYMDSEDDWSVISYIRLGQCYESMGEEEEQIECYKKALEYSKERNDYVDMADIYSVLGIYHAQRGDTDKEEELLKKSLEYAKKAWGEESDGVAGIYQYLASNCNLKKEYQEAIRYSERALNIYLNSENVDNQRDIASLYNNIGFFNLKLGNTNDALSMMEKSYEIVKENQEKKNISEFYENVLSVNIKALYDKTAADEIGYDEWFKQNFES